MQMVNFYHVCSIIVQGFVDKHPRMLLFVIIIVIVIITVICDLIPLIYVKNIHLTGRAIFFFKNGNFI